MEEAPKTKLYKSRRCQSNVWVLLFSVYDVLPLPWSCIGCTRVKPHHFSNPLHLVSCPLTPAVTSCECIFNVLLSFVVLQPVNLLSVLHPAQPWPSPLVVQLSFILANLHVNCMYCNIIHIDNRKWTSYELLLIFIAKTAFLHLVMVFRNQNHTPPLPT